MKGHGKLQAILYDENGMVWSVIDPMGDYELPTNTSETMAKHFPGAVGKAGCGVIHYAKQRDPDIKDLEHEFHAWQRAVDRHLGK